MIRPPIHTFDPSTTDRQVVRTVGGKAVWSDEAQLLTGIHSARPAAADVPGGLYSCTTHGLIYKSDGSTWSTWLTLPSASGAVATDVIWDTKGDIAVATGADAASKLAVGSNGQVLTADSTQATGVKWATAASGSVATDTIFDAKGDLPVGTAADAAAKLVVGSNGQVLTADSTQATGVKWATPSSGFADPLTTKGDLIVRTASATTRIAAGANGQVLTADSTATEGVKWAAASGSSTPVGPDGKRTVDTLPTSANAKDDEFNDTSGHSGPSNGLDAQWSKRNLGTSGWLVLDDSKAPGTLLFDIPTGQSADQSIYQAAPAGDFTVACRIEAVYGSMSDRQMWGPFIVDSSGAGLGTFFDEPGSDGNTRQRGLSAWANSSAPAVVRTDLNARWIAGEPIILSIRKSGTTYYSSGWLGGRQMPTIVTEVSSTSSFTVANIGFGRIFGTGKARMLLDWFRVS